MIGNELFVTWGLLVRIASSELCANCDLQADHGSEESQKSVEKLMPQKVKKRRKIQTEDGVSNPYSV